MMQRLPLPEPLILTEADRLTLENSKDHVRARDARMPSLRSKKGWRTRKRRAGA